MRHNAKGANAPAKGHDEAGRAWIDVSAPLANGMVHWPGDPAFRIERVLDQSKGDAANVSLITMGSHTGTHMDAPVHFIPGGVGIDQAPLDVITGPARLIDTGDADVIAAEHVPSDLEPGARILFRTRNSMREWVDRPFAEDFVYVSLEAARKLAERRVRLVGVDYLSVGGYHKDGKEVHQTLLGNGVWIIEGLYLQDIEAGAYDLVALPMKIVGGDGAPTRVLLRRLR